MSSVTNFYLMLKLLENSTESQEEKRNKKTLKNNSKLTLSRHELFASTASVVKRLSTFRAFFTLPILYTSPDRLAINLFLSFPFSFNPTDLTPLFHTHTYTHTHIACCSSFFCFVSFPTSHIHTALFAYDKCAPFACRVPALKQTPSLTLTRYPLIPSLSV